MLPKWSFTNLYKFEESVRIGIILTFCLLLLLVCGSFYSLRKIVKEQEMLISGHAEELILAERVRFQMQVEYSAMPAFVLSGRDENISQFHYAHRNFTILIAQLIESFEDTETKNTLYRVRTLEEKLYSDIALPGIAMRSAGVNSQTVHGYFAKNAQAMSNELYNVLDNFVRNKLDEFNQAKLKAASNTRQTTTILTIASILILGLASFIVYLLFKMIRQKKIKNEDQELLLQKERVLSNARKEILEIVSHDLKNPLSSIAMSLDLLRADTEKRSKYIEVISRSTESMKKLINDLLDHAKIESGNLMLDLKECNAHSFIHSQILQFKLLAEKKSIKLTAHVERDLPRFHCDQNRMSQVCANLLGNAIKFTPQHGEIVVGVVLKKGEVIFSVQNSGPQIPEEQIPHIFDRFWQARETANQGTGLGLAISKAIIEAHGGRIWVESDEHHTIFCVSLPISKLSEIKPNQSLTTTVPAILS